MAGSENKYPDVKNSVCVLYDPVSESFSAPLTFSNDKDAQRYLKNAVKRDFKAKDMVLYNIGTYNPFTGVLVVNDQMKLLARGAEYEEEV